MRIDPPPSVAVATPTSPAQSAAADPPLEPVARDPGQEVRGVALDGELGQGGLAEHDRTGVEQALGYDAIRGGGRHVAKGQRSLVGPVALPVLQVLDQHGHSGEGTDRTFTRIDEGSILAGVVEGLLGQHVEGGIGHGQSLHRGVDQISDREATFSHRRRERGDRTGSVSHDSAK
jgi:hypothetical protein